MQFLWWKVCTGALVVKCITMFLSQSAYVHCNCWSSCWHVLLKHQHVVALFLDVQHTQELKPYTGLILGMHLANEKRRYKVTPSFIGWAQTWNQPWYSLLRITAKKELELRINSPWWGKPLLTGGFPSQRASNAERFMLDLNLDSTLLADLTPY